MTVIAELIEAERAKAKVKDLAAAKELEAARVHLEELNAAIVALEDKERAYVAAKQYATAEETKVRQ